MSLRFSLFLSMIGWMGSGTVTNFTGSPVLVSFQRSVKVTPLSYGSVRPRRRLTAVWRLSSFSNWPPDSRWKTPSA